LAERTHPFVDDFHTLINSCVSFYTENKDQMDTNTLQERRAALSASAEAFHKDCGTLTPSVEKKIADLRIGNGLVLMTAHQPNLFPYSGVFRKATANFLLGRKLEEILRVPAVNFFGIADQDFTDDRWVKSCQLPAVKRRKGILEIKAKLPEKVMLNKVPKPPSSLLRKWRKQIERWLNKAIRSVGGLGEKQGLTALPPGSSLALRENLDLLWSLVEDCHELAESYSDFNAFVMSKIVNDIWEYDTLFCRFSQCQRDFAGEFGFLLSRFDVYSRSIEQSGKLPRLERFDGGISDQESRLAPFWYHCGCGSKVRLFLTEEGGSLYGKGICLGCENYYEIEFGSKEDPDISDIASQISARAIPMVLVFFSGLMPSCYVGGVGGIRYLSEARHAADCLKISFPPVVVWRPHDRYLGVGQLEAILEKEFLCNGVGVHEISTAKDLLDARISEIRDRLEKLEMSKETIMEKLKADPDDSKLRRELKEISISKTEFVRNSNLSIINRELKILQNVSTVLELMPSIIDYAVNVGLEETSDQWIRHLIEKGNLSSDVHLESKLSRDFGLSSGLLTGFSISRVSEL
jgi:hypothetical protein